jgi:hypothetical protein
MVSAVTSSMKAAWAPLTSRNPPRPDEISAAPPAWASRAVRPKGSCQIEGQTAISACSFASLTNAKGRLTSISMRSGMFWRIARARLNTAGCSWTLLKMKRARHSGAFVSALVTPRAASTQPFS